MTNIVLRMHYHDNDGLPDQLEVVEAPPELNPNGAPPDQALAMAALIRSIGQALGVEVHGG